MTEEQVALVKRTWRIFRDIDPVLVGDVFYSKLFVEHPSLKHFLKLPGKFNRPKWLTC
jgi:hypothetical protein